MSFHTITQMSACITHITRITQVTLKTVNNTVLIYNCWLCFLHIYSCSIFRFTNTVMTTPKRRILSFAFSVLYLILASFIYLLLVPRPQAVGTGHKVRWVFSLVLCYLRQKMVKLRNNTHEAFAAFVCCISQTAETKPRRIEATGTF